MRIVRSMIGLSAIALLARCSVGPQDTRPPVTTSAVYKENLPQSFEQAGTWKPAQPSDQELRGKWWEAFGDPQLNALEEQVTVSNQRLKQAEACFRHARAM